MAAAARRAGHRVTWVRCPEQARTARELEKTLRRQMPRHDVLVMAAAVCDVRPLKTARGKIKKDALGTVRFVKNPDILAGLARSKRPGQVFVGFALESEAALANATKKLAAKRLDAIVLQKISAGRAPFGERPVDAWVIEKNGAVTTRRRTSKRALASFLVRRAGALYRA